GGGGAQRRGGYARGGVGLGGPRPAIIVGQVPDDFVQRGKGLLVRREFAEVVSVCRAGLSEYPDALDGRLLLGTALLALKHYDEAIDEMRIAEAQDQTNVLVHLLRGEALLRRGGPQGARPT